MAKWNEVPVFICDAFYIQNVSTGNSKDDARIAFGHTINGETTYHTGISLSKANATQMRDLLDQHICNPKTH